MLQIIDFGIGNIHSVLHKISKLGISATISSNPDQVRRAERLILPGVGNFRSAMDRLHRRNLVEALNEVVLERGVPVLGICLGMQLFARSSQEGNADGLGWLDAEVVRFDFSDIGRRLSLPHVGWNNLHIIKSNRLLNGIDENQRFYFTHSYHLTCSADQVLARTKYGVDFVSIVQHNNICGVQFHPEKSHRRGLQIIKNFIDGTRI